MEIKNKNDEVLKLPLQQGLSKGLKVYLKTFKHFIYVILGTLAFIIPGILFYDNIEKIINEDDIFSIVFGIFIIYIAYIILKSFIIWLYKTLRIIGRVIIAILTTFIIQFVTQSLFGIGITDFTWGSIGSGLIMAFMFPNTGS